MPEYPALMVNSAPPNTVRVNLCLFMVQLRGMVEEEEVMVVVMVEEG